MLNTEHTANRHTCFGDTSLEKVYGALSSELAIDEYCDYGSQTGKQ